MGFLLIKYAVTALVIVVVSEVAKRADRMGALISALPWMTILVMIWLYVEKQGNGKIANHAWFTFWYVLPTMPMFLLLPWMLNRGVAFWPSMGAAAILTLVCFVVVAVVARRFGVVLW